MMLITVPAVKQTERPMNELRLVKWTHGRYTSDLIVVAVDFIVVVVVGVQRYFTEED